MSSTIRPTFKDILGTIPGVFGIRLEEEPAFDTIENVGDVEIRRYRAALLARVTVAGDHDKALDKAFSILARYIFGDNRSETRTEMTVPVMQEESGERMPMTTPVLQSAAGNAWTVAFFLSNDLTPESAPQPNDPSIELVTQPETVLGSLRYTGNNTEERRAKAKGELLNTLAGQSRWRVIDNVSWAQYDQPFAIPILKRNEAHVALQENSHSENR